MQFSHYTWDLYKQSELGKKAITFFEYDSVFWNDVEVIKKYHFYLAQIINDREYTNLMQEFGEIASENREFNFKDFSEVRACFENYLEQGVFYEYDDEKTYLIEPKDYQLFLEYNLIMSFYFYAIAYDFTFPNLFTYRFFDLNKIVDTFDIKLPKIPKKSDYKARCMYYIDLCEVFYNFRIKNNLTPNELCAFLYDFAPNFVEKDNSEIPKPSQAWFIGGKIAEDEFLTSDMLWQCNAETKKGDILVHYQTSPISAITHIWRSKVDGVRDPFFYYYANSYLTDCIEIPRITLKELQADEYFSTLPIVRKKFQGVNGWAISNQDYVNLLRLIRQKGSDVDTLPMPHAPEPPKGIEIHNERDVEVKLLEYYLNQVGYIENRDFIRQLPVRAGRGNRIYPDYALHYNATKGYETAKILIEAKHHLKSNQDLEEAFKQARSYANILESEKIIICDKYGMTIYQKQGSFDRNNYTKIYWEGLNNPDEFNQFKQIVTN
ncbi:hypothetical protein CAPN010_16340 [Capnocytophaga cynodegmi]|uniref:type I restriction endonuclease subunit R n=1 Tax=Capnocytophaga cynodegmi TaxID=28189 RepID=UPI001EE2EBB4|nr:type I restriction endonuclease subunit R [Capnocytophaga cynodegmi]GJQ07476.1 hypothetical protein CAPN010_16340 [Capnocytophaga cynodegmi]